MLLAINVGYDGCSGAALAGELHACLGNSVKVQAVELPSSTVVAPTTWGRWSFRGASTNRDSLGAR